MGDGTLRVLKIATIVMGVMIVLGTAGLFVAMMRRTAPPPAVSANLAAVLDEPAGTRIAGIVAIQDWLALHLQGGGADRIVLIDPRSGAVTGRIALSR
ncbi:MAG: hypothetical protein AB7F35_07370 [Acetobacteraceae bacterium]